MLYLGLRTVADDEGRGGARTATLRRRVHFYATDVTDADVQLAFEELCVAGVVRSYEVGGEPYFTLRDFLGEERISHPTPSKIPPPPPIPPSVSESDPVSNGPESDEPCLSIFRLWNEEANPELPRVSSISSARRSKARARWSEHPDLDWWSAQIYRLNDEHSSGAKDISIEFLLLPPTQITSR